MYKDVLPVPHVLATAVLMALAGQPKDVCFQTQVAARRRSVALLGPVGTVQEGYELLPHAIWQFDQEPDEIRQRLSKARIRDLCAGFCAAYWRNMRICRGFVVGSNPMPSALGFFLEDRRDAALRRGGHVDRCFAASGMFARMSGCLFAAAPVRLGEAEELLSDEFEKLPGCFVRIGAGGTETTER
jgi:hypothetical protein